MDIPSPAAVAKQLFQAPLIGSFFALLVYGIMCVQTLYYFQTYPEDHIAVKFMVAILWVIETVHSGFNMSFINRYLIANFGNLLALLNISWDLLVCVQAGFVSGFIVNVFFTIRIYRFTKNIWAFLLLMLMTTFRFAASTVAVNIGAIDPAWVTFGARTKHLVTAIASVGLAADTLSALILARYLNDGRTGIQRTDRLINRLLVYVVASGGITALITALTLISVLASPNTGLYLAFTIVLEKVYANSALMTLNIRQYQRSVLSQGPVSISLNGFRAGTQMGDTTMVVDGTISKSAIGTSPHAV